MKKRAQTKPYQSFDSYGRDFYDWLLSQPGRPDLVGELAAELRRSDAPPPQEYEPFRTYINVARFNSIHECSRLKSSEFMKR